MNYLQGEEMWNFIEALDYHFKKLPIKHILRANSSDLQEMEETIASLRHLCEAYDPNETLLISQKLSSQEYYHREWNILKIN